MNERLFALVSLLQRIAAYNEDEWQFKIEIGMDTGVVSMEVVEKADGHTLVSGYGKSMEAAINHLESELPACLEEWGYKLPS